MAIDSTLFVCDIPAATYAVGDTILMKVVRGPANVRSGYGAAVLKRMVAGRLAGSTAPVFDVHLKNSNWVDEISNIAGSPQITTFDENSSQVQECHNAPLTANSSWYVYAKCIAAGTLATADTAFALIDVDYPAVANVANPRMANGFPVTTELTLTSAVNTIGNLENGVSVGTINVDILKAGSRYLLADAFLRSVAGAIDSIAFISISGAAGQNGLERIIPIFAANNAALRFPVTYSTPFVKGPFNVNVITTGAAATMFVQFDWVKG